jgi:MFS family permease
MITFARQLYHLLFPGVHLNRSLRILITVSTLMNFVIGMFSPFYAIFVLKIGGDIAFAGLSWAVFEVVCGVLMLLFTRWGLRVREQELLIALGFILRSGVFLSYAFMTTMTQLLLTQVLWGIAAAIGIPAFDAVFAAHTSKDGSIAEWGGLEGVTSIAIGIAALLGGLVIKSFGFTSIFIGMAALTFGLGVYIWRLPREVL